MLGSLSRWLRLFGCEVKYHKRASDNELLKIAKDEGRILLTRDLELFRRAKSMGLEVFFVEGLLESERLANVSRRFKVKLEVDTSSSRCPICNSPIKKVIKAEVFDKVPLGTYKRYNNFWRCTGCEKVYWRGSHWRNINETIVKAQKLLERKTY